VADVGVSTVLEKRTRNSSKKWGSDSNYFKNGGQIPINLAGFFSAGDTRFQQNFEFMYHKNGRKSCPR
jgi:hypothetical protein